MSRTFVPRIPSDSGEDPNGKKDDGQFTFSNGDVYVGGYMLAKDKQFLSKRGRGIYVTEDFNRYETYWVDDQIIGEVNIRYNNGTRYKGTLGIDGGMFGFGIYTFTDNSVLEASWKNNNPVNNIILREPSGSVWEGVYYGKEVAFTARNHFWVEISPPIDDEDGEVEPKENLDMDSNY